MKIADLAGKTICILGYGKEGKAMAEALEKYAAGCEITIADKNASLEVPDKYWKQLGEGWLQNLDKFDIIIKSPGIPPHALLTTDHLPLTTSTQIFLDTIADSGAVVIGVTGSKGKSTTSSLIHHILANCQKPNVKCHLIGNIGEPAIAHIADATKDTVFILELSSYQLMDLDCSLGIAVVTSFFPEHLDYHGSLEAYLEAKKHLTRFQKKGDIVFYDASNESCKEIAEESKGKKVAVSEADAPLDIATTKLQGKHNLRNLALAWKVAEFMGVPKKEAVAAIQTFIPLKHRLETVAIRDGVEWVNDSISTTPESAIAALNALGDRVQTIIVGGQDRGYDFKNLAKRLKESSVQTIILFPESGNAIRKELKALNASLKLVDAKTMTEAVNMAQSETRASRVSTQSSTLKAQSFPIVLLSPASPSYNMFKNFEDRGDQFRECTKKL